jgi:acyl carrier protein
MEKTQLMQELKLLIIEECEKDLVPQDIGDDEILIGEEGSLDLDSLDALQIALAVKERYGKRIDGNNETRNALTSVGTLADYILA